MPRRDELTDAAIALIAAEGVRALTHRAVDSRAGAPAGTTSNHFRTRAALLDGVAVRLESLDLEIWTVGEDLPQTAAELLRSLAEYAAAMTTTYRAASRARVALMVENPRSLVAGHRRLVAGLADILRTYGIGSPERAARDLMDYLDGVIVHHAYLRVGEPVDVRALAATMARIAGEAR